MSVHALAVSGTNLFAGTRGGGVFLSTNNGSNWSAINTNLVYNAYVRTLAGSETDVFAVTRGCIFQSVDNGANWIARNKGLYYYDNYSFVKNGNNLFTGTFNGIVLRSSDEGASWTYAGIGLTDATVWALAVNGSNLFAGTYGGGVFLSTNNGTDWTTVNSGLSNLTVTSLIVSDNNLYVGTYGGGVFLSTNNGTTWTAISNSGLTNKNIRALAVQGTNLIAGTQDAGVFYYSSSTSSWSTMNSGLTNLNIRSFAVYGNNLLVGTGGGVYLSTNSGASWSQVSPELTNKSVMALAISGSNLYAGIWGTGVWQKPMSEIFVTSGNPSSSVAADYFLPLCVGNYIKLNTTGNDGRTTYYRIVKAETINNETYYAYRGSEIMNNNPIEETFNYSWLRKDATGNILIGAYDPTLNGTLSSAITTLPFGSFFPNQFLTLDYSRSFVWENALQTDSVVSISATTGIYTNCIQIRNTVKTKGVVQRIDDSYYAYHVGLIREERVFPTNEARVSNMVDFNSTNCYSTGISEGIVDEKEVNIYPNPSKHTLFITGLTQNSKCSIFDLSGKQLINKQIVNNQIDISQLINGIYILRISDKNGITMKKFVKQ